MAYTAAVGGAPTVIASVEASDVPVPSNYKAAVTSPLYGPYWREAINKELKGLIERDTWEVILEEKLPRGANVMNCHMIFSVKRKSDGTIDRFKCRLVATYNVQGLQ